MTDMYLYKCGQWEEIESKDYGFLDEDCEIFSEFLKKSGFWSSSCYNAGNYPYFGFQIYTHVEKKWWFCDLTINEDVNHILITQLPSLLHFLKEYTSLFNDYYKSRFIKDVNHDYVNIDHVESVVFDHKGKNRIGEDEYKIYLNTKEKEYCIETNCSKSIFKDFSHRILGIFDE